MAGALALHGGADDDGNMQPGQSLAGAPPLTDTAPPGGGWVTETSRAASAAGGTVASTGQVKPHPNAASLAGGVASPTPAPPLLLLLPPLELLDPPEEDPLVPPEGLAVVAHPPSIATTTLNTPTARTLACRDCSSLRLFMTLQPGTHALENDRRKWLEN